MARFNVDDYVDVQTRINDFWKQYPDGAILTRFLSDPGDFDRVVVQAEVYKHRDDARPSGSDIAAEERGKNGMANTTSWHENCATSAIGRALADIGMAKSQKDRPSRQEMEKVERHEPAPPIPITVASQRDLAALHATAGESGIDHGQLHAWAESKGKASLKEMSADEVKTLTRKLKDPEQAQAFHQYFPRQEAANA